MEKPQLNEEEMEAVREAFAMMDNDGNGSISTREFGIVMRGLGQAVTEAEVQDMVKDIDTDGNGSISFEEFVDMMTVRLKQRDPEEEMKEAFAVFDRDRTGYIDAHDVQQVLVNMGEHISLKEAGEMLEEADVNGDGRVTFPEFAAMIRNS